jgi:hypothetical protein
MGKLCCWGRVPWLWAAERGGWRLARDELLQVSYVRNTVLDWPLADRGALCVRFNSSGIRA